MWYIPDRGVSMMINYMSPVKGEQFDVSKASDDVFSEGLLGSGFVIHPTDHFVYAPIDGIISMIFPTKHAIAIKHISGVAVLIHVGFNTVDLKGNGFTLHTSLNQRVKQGDLILEFDDDYLRKNASSLETSVVFMQKDLILVHASKVIKEHYHMEIEVVAHDS
jgi:glucose-specific phosphotransferase system IIA component